MANPITVPAEVFELLVQSNRFFEALNGDSAEMHARDSTDPIRPLRHAEYLLRYANLQNAKVLEIGSGYGMNLVVWSKEFSVDMYGIEPNAPEWGASYQGARLLLEANDIDPSRVVDAVGENIPFADSTFDIVYSGNALEHVQDPDRVISEAIRVVRPGGIVHFEVPNYFSYYEGHYSVLKPPMTKRKSLARWVRMLGKDPNFAYTLNLITPKWCRRAAARLPVDLLSVGEDIFLDRMATPFRFEMEISVRNTNRVVSAMQRLNWGNWIGHLLVATDAFYPIFLTLRKRALEAV